MIRLDRADRLVDQASVLRLQLLDPLVELLAGSDVLGGQRVDDRLLLGVDLALELLEPLADLLRRLGPDLLQILGQALHVRRDLGLAGRDPLLRRRQLGPDDVRDARDDLVHLLEVELPAGHVELVDLVRHPADLVPQPAELARPAAVAVLLVRRHLGRDVVLERRAGGLLAVLELLLDLGVDAVEDLLHVRLGRVEDRLDLRGDLGPPLLVLRLRLALVRDELGERGALGALHAGDALLGLGGGLGPALRDDLLLLLAELPRRLVGVGRGLLLVGERLLELRLVGLRELGVGDLALGHLVGDLVLAGLEVDLLGRCGLGHRTGRRDRHGRPGCSVAIGVTGFGTAFDWSGGASVAASMSLAWPSLPWVTRPLTSPLTSPALPDSL